MLTINFFTKILQENTSSVKTIAIYTANCGKCSLHSSGNSLNAP